MILLAFHREHIIHKCRIMPLPIPLEFQYNHSGPITLMFSFRPSIWDFYYFTLMALGCAPFVFFFFFTLCILVVSKHVKWIFAQWVFPKHACKANDVANCLFYGSLFSVPRTWLTCLWLTFTGQKDCSGLFFYFFCPIGEIFINIYWFGFISQRGGGRNLAGLVAMVTSISHVYSPASSQGSEQNPKPTCSFKLRICSFYISNTIERMYNIDN